MLGCRVQLYDLVSVITFLDKFFIQQLLAGISTVRETGSVGWMDTFGAMHAVVI